MADAGTGAATTAGRGLEGIVVAESELSLVDGTNGRLYYRGYSIHDLVQSASFEEVLYLLWYGELPTRAELDELNAKLVAARALSPSVMEVLRVLPRGGEPIDALRAAVTVMGMEDDDAFNFSRDALLERSIRLTGAMATMLAAFDRLRHGKEPVEPDPSLGHAANFLYMLRGERASELQERAMDAYLVLLAEHSMNASTFSARVTLSALSDIYSAVSSALGTLKGDAHGGANRRAMEMLLAIGSADKAEAYVEESLRIKRRLMGLGHRIYKTRDPRVDHLMGYSEKVAAEKGDTTWHDLAVRLEQITSTHPYFLERKLFPNVEFYSAPLLYALLGETDLMPAVFGVSRIGGWTANLLEQAAANRIIRPQAAYVGPDPRPYVPLEQRG
ncbi:citrate/2-methylcitrate synthase [Sphaerobacter sp.]|mgnify:FL=1|uniref:citrate/2-methylcitrate synthase n=1 Tax=Sphaerobacter sp. TaxID=2099654 RepID=UPI001E1716B7|nr:citrate/2-methylcitrate synthase [Sphaerobacter sp.]MBX5444343.1 tungsten formylmethanofuran dehydrogenase [Sphaerobacter sp.]